MHRGGMAGEDEHGRTRKILGMAAFFWVTTVLALILGMRTRLKPVLVVAVVNGVIALLVTQFWLRRRPPNS